MQDGVAADHVEGLIRKIERLGIHRLELDLDTGRARAGPGIRHGRL